LRSKQRKPILAFGGHFAAGKQQSRQMVLRAHKKSLAARGKALFQNFLSKKITG
jgi:hypothetical protein